MLTSKKGLDMIKEFEGCVLHAYDDGTGTLTIGYGHTKDVYAGQTITQDEAEKLLLDDVHTFEIHVTKYDRIYHWTQSEFDALVSFAFNIGSIEQLTQNGTRNKKTIAEYMLKYVYAGGVKLDGLVTRRKKEYELFTSTDNVSRETLTGDYLLNENMTIKELIDLIVRGYYGNDNDRKEYLYNDIQHLVNLRFK